MQQLWGGYGYMNEYMIANLFAACRVFPIYGGTSEIMREIIARSLWNKNWYHAKLFFLYKALKILYSDLLYTVFNERGDYLRVKIAYEFSQRFVLFENFISLSFDNTFVSFFNKLSVWTTEDFLVGLIWSFILKNICQIGKKNGIWPI